MTGHADLLKTGTEWQPSFKGISKNPTGLLLIVLSLARLYNCPQSFKAQKGISECFLKKKSRYSELKLDLRIQ